ncbi:MAG TPA: ankyrin repeat domain-containing protein [Bryobacteraceae bacterium]|nr:ankyrin repeat domain-containing protein [Bryobacteraceae bacterium]
MKNLFDAIRAGDLGAVQTFVEEDPSKASARDDNGVSAYMIARYNRQNAIADWLLGRGIETDIFEATVAGDRARVEQLLDSDRSLVRALTRDGWTPLHLAAFFGQKEVAEALIAHGADVNARSVNAMRNMPLHAAAAGRSNEVVGVLLAHGADVNARQQGGWTALHAAAQSGDAAMATALLDAGAEVNARADNSQNPMDLAMTGGHQNVAEILEKRGARI